jgi:phosphomannomutase
MKERSEEVVLITDLMAQSGVTFGTSGARGRVDAMTDRVCYSYTVAFLQHLADTGAIHAGDRVVFAGDNRPSTPRILAAVAQAVRDLGYRCVNAGRVSTPALATHAMALGASGIMVTGSHIPDDRNGIKFYRPDGEIMKQDEQGIREQRVVLRSGQFDDAGSFVDAPYLPGEDESALRRYVERFLDFFPPGCLRGSRILVYEHSTVAVPALVEIVGGLGAEVIRKGYSEIFLPVDTEAIRPEDVALAKHWAEEEQFDAIISADGDGDRPLVADEHGEWLRGDAIGVLAARFLDAAVVVTPISSNTAVERCGWFDEVVRTRIGSPYVIDAMRKASEAGAGVVVGYEANGGFLQQTAISRDGKILAPLPTRDAAIVAITVLLQAKAEGLPVSGLGGLMPLRFTASDRIKDFPTEISQQLIAELSSTPVAIRELFSEMGEIASIDQTDGLRIAFECDEIIHLRPSGNAPELRCYAEAATLERAQQLTRDGIARLRDRIGTK